MREQEHTICALATPAGEGGIAVVRISGAQAYAVASRVFCPIQAGKKVADAAGYTAMFGHFMKNEKPCDETVALFFRAPRSYTGEDVVELSCHGGSAMVSLLLEACYEAGAKPAGAGEFTKRAFLNGRIGLTQAEGVMGVISAAGRQGAALAAAALDGALAKEIAQVQQILVSLLGHISAWVDFPEEDVPALQPEKLQASVAQCAQTLDRLVQSYGAGAVLQRGVKAAIVGSPNVGKSTLLNLLAGFDRAIVTSVAGTTRDVVEQVVQVGNSGVRLILADTAGLRETADEVEAEGIRRSRVQMEQAGLVIAVFDASRAITPEDLSLAQQCAGQPAVAVINKTDLPRAFAVEHIAPYFGQVVEISASQAGYQQAVGQAVEQVLGLSQLDPNAAALISERQYRSTCDARAHLQAAIEAAEQGFGLDVVGICLEDTLNALYELSGETASEAAIEEVFSTFCVGK